MRLSGGIRNICSEIERNLKLVLDSCYRTSDHRILGSSSSLDGWENQDFCDLKSYGWDNPEALGFMLFFSGSSDGKKHLPTMWETWVGKIPWRGKWQPTPVLLPGKLCGWRSLVGYSPWDHKELDMTEQLHWWWTDDPQEVTCSSQTSFSASVTELHF